MQQQLNQAASGRANIDAKKAYQKRVRKNDDEDYGEDDDEDGQNDEDEDDDMMDEEDDE